MKCSVLVCIIVFLLMLLPKVKAGDPVCLSQLPDNPGHTSILFKHTPKQAVALCKEYERKRIAGYVIMPAGAIALGGGAYMVYRGMYNTISQYNKGTYDYRNQSSSRRDVGFVCGGTALMVVGAALMPGGAILSSVANVKYCKYCRAGGAVYISPSRTGLGLACNF